MSYTVPSAVALSINMANIVSWAQTLFGSINGFVELGLGLVLAVFFITLIGRSIHVAGGRGRR